MDSAVFPAQALHAAQHLSQDPLLKLEAARLLIEGTVDDRERFLTLQARAHGPEQGFLLCGLLFAEALARQSRHSNTSMGGRRNGDAEEAARVAAAEMLGIQYSPAELFSNEFQEKLKNAYRRLSILFHPDRRGGATDKFDALSKARNLLDRDVLLAPEPHMGTREEELVMSMIEKEAERIARNRNAEPTWADRVDDFMREHSRSVAAVTGLVAAGIIATAVYKLWWKPRKARQAQAAEHDRALHAFSTRGRAKPLSSTPTSTPSKAVHDASSPTVNVKVTGIVATRVRRPSQISFSSSRRALVARPRRLAHRRTTKAAFRRVSRGGVVHRPSPAQLQLAAIIQEAVASVPVLTAHLPVKTTLMQLNAKSALETAAALRSTNPDTRLAAAVVAAARRLWRWTKAVGASIWGLLKHTGSWTVSSLWR